MLWYSSTQVYLILFKIIYTRINNFWIDHSNFFSSRLANCKQKWGQTQAISTHCEAVLSACVQVSTTTSKQVLNPKKVAPPQFLTPRLDWLQKRCQCTAQDHLAAALLDIQHLNPARGHQWFLSARKKSLRRPRWTQDRESKGQATQLTVSQLLCCYTVATGRLWLVHLFYEFWHWIFEL